MKNDVLIRWGMIREKYGQTANMSGSHPLILSPNQRFKSDTISTLLVLKVMMVDEAHVRAPKNQPDFLLGSGNFHKTFRLVEDGKVENRSIEYILYIYNVLYILISHIYTNINMIYIPDFTVFLNIMQQYTGIYLSTMYIICFIYIYAGLLFASSHYDDPSQLHGAA